MMSTQVDGNGSLGFKVWRGAPRVMTGSHLHSDIEINFVLSGKVEYFFGGRFHELQPDELALFWAGMPHVLTRVEEPGEMIWAVVPLAWFLQWEIGEKLSDALLRGQLLAFGSRSGLEREKFAQWSEDFADAPDNANSQKIVALEIEALLRRLAHERKINSPRRKMSTPVGAMSGQIEKLAVCVSRRYREDLTIQEIAREVNLHPNYAMQLFKERCGLSLWDYVLRLRVSHAQYLLLTTHRKMSDIARESGFASPSRFYAAFEKYCGLAPRAWREAMKKES